MADTARSDPGGHCGDGHCGDRITVSDDDLRAIVSTLVEKAKAGDVMAAREVLDRLLGKAKISIESEPPDRRTPEEIIAAIRALEEAHPELMRRAEAGATP